MAGFWKVLVNAVRTLVKFVGLTVLTILALTVSLLINYVAIACMNLWLLVPGFKILTPNFPLLASVSRFLGLGGS